MKTRLCKTFTFHAAHQLPNHNGQCKRLHGHTYRLDVVVEGEVRPQDGSSEEGMVIDFGRLKDIYKVAIEPLVEHQNLNETLPVAVTTAENIARWVYGVYDESLSRTRSLPSRARLAGPFLVAVRVWETETSYAEAAT